MRCDCKSAMALLLTSSTASWTRLCLRSPLVGSTHYCHNYFTSIRQHFELTTVFRASQLICNLVPASKSARYMRHCDTRVMPAVVSLSNVEDQVGACVHLSKTPGPAVNDEQLRAREKDRESERERERHMSPNPPTRRYLVSAFEQKKTTPKPLVACIGTHHTTRLPLVDRVVITKVPTTYMCLFFGFGSAFVPFSMISIEL